MLYRARSGALVRCDRTHYTTDKEYYRAIIAAVFHVQQKNAETEPSSLEANRIANLVKTQVCKSHTR